MNQADTGARTERERLRERIIEIIAEAPDKYTGRGASAAYLGPNEEWIADAVLAALAECTPAIDPIAEEPIPAWTAWTELVRVIEDVKITRELGMAKSPLGRKTANRIADALRIAGIVPLLRGTPVEIRGDV